MEVKTFIDSVQDSAHDPGDAGRVSLKETGKLLTLSEDLEIEFKHSQVTSSILCQESENLSRTSMLFLLITSANDFLHKCPQTSSDFSVWRLLCAILLCRCHPALF